MTGVGHVFTVPLLCVLEDYMDKKHVAKIVRNMMEPY